MLSLGFAWAMLGTGELESSEAYLRDAERWLEPADLRAEASSVVTAQAVSLGMSG